ncbi:manganese ion binding protein [Aureococcus anophagefferens]|nr:manganese ion binding protein [Aureococcus anophagefferens]
MPVDLTFEPLSTAKAAVTVIIGRQHNLAGMFEGATAVGSMNAALWRTMVEKGYGGLWGVGKAAAEPPALCVLSYVPAAAAKSVCLVGKGIVYDTGGLAIKSVAGMCGMKMDMGGAAALMGAFEAAVAIGTKDSLHCALCLAENAVGPGAFRATASSRSSPASPAR